MAKKNLVLGLAVTAALAGQSAQAFETNTGNPDLSIRFDNTLRYNAAVRVEERDSKIGNSAVADEGTYSFDKNDMVANRFDLLSELDVVWKKNYGFRVSGTAWWDGAYGDKGKGNPNAPLAAIPSYVGNQYSPYIKRFYQGGSGELLDAFVFAGFDMGSVPTSFKVGRHTLYWGESLFLGGNLHSVAYAQNPLDLQKGFATPGTEAKELFRPLNQISGRAQLTDTLSVAAQYFFEWQEFRYPEGGTYLGPVDFAFNGPDRQFLSAGLGFASRGNPYEPKKNGEWGIAARWSPEWLDGTVGFYYRNFSDKLPQTFLTRAAPANGSVYNLIYKDDIDLFGVSLAKNVAGVSVGAEFSMRQNTPLNSQVLGNAAAASAGGIARGTTPGPVGDTLHALVNFLGVIPQTGLFDSASWAAEFTWSRWDKVKSGANLFNAVGFAGCTFAGRAGDKWDGCATKTFVGAAVGFTPTWFQVFPGVDIQAPMTYAQGLRGNAALVFGGNEALGNYTVGLAADVFQKYRFDLKYIDFVGKYRDNGTAVTSQNGFTTFLVDRGHVSLTFKTTF